MADPGRPGDIPSWENAGKRAPAPKRRGRRLRIALIALGSIVVLLLILVALAPTIGGAIAPGYARDAINASINGKAEVSSVSLSWFGGQRVGPVTITDNTGQVVARINVIISRGLFGLARGAVGLGDLDLGQATVSGSATIVRRPDGTTNIQDLVAKPGAGPAPAGRPGGSGAGRTRLPEITAGLTFDKLDVRFIDQSRPGAPAAAVRLPALSGTASIVRSKTADAAMATDLVYGSDPDHITTPGGSLSLTAHADSLTDSAGNLTTDQASIDFKADAKDIATAIADTLAGMDNRLAAALGDKLQASVRAAGTMSKGDATITASSRALNADLAFNASDGLLTVPRPGRITVQTAGLPALSPSLGQALKSGQTATFDRLPNVTAVLEQFKLALPVGGRALDLRGAALAISVETTEASGSVRVPSRDGGAAQAQPFRVAPLKARLASEDLAKSVSLTANTTATIAGQSAGTLAVNLTASGLLDGSGRPRPGIPMRVVGSADLTGVATAIAQPFAEPAGIDLARDVGPQLELSLRASATGEAAPDSTSGSPPAVPATHLALDVKSANLNSAVRLVHDQNTLRSERGGIQVRIGEIGPLATRLLKDAGITVENGGPVALTVTDLAVDLNRLSKAGAPGPDLRAVSGAAKVETGRIAGRLAPAGQPVRAFQVAPLTATLDASDLSKGASLKATTSATLDGSPAGTLEVDVRASGLVNSDGSRGTRLPAIDGRVTLAEIATAIAQPWVESAGLDLQNGVGPRLDLTLTATPAPASPGGAGTVGPIPTTAIDLKIKSTNLNGSVALVIDRRTIRKRGDSELTLRSPGALAGRAARSKGVALADGGYAKFTARDLAVVFDEAWAVRPDQSTLDLDLTAGGLTITGVPSATPSAQTPALVVALEQLVVGARLAPGQPPVVDIKGSGSHQSAAFSAQGSLQLYGLLTPVPKGGVAVTPANVRPVGSIDLSNVPTSLVTLAMPAAAPKTPNGSGLDLARLVREAIGPAVTVRVASTRPANSPPGFRALTLSLQADRFSGGLAAGIDDKALAVSRLDFRGQVTPDLAAALIDMAGPGLASRPNLVSPATITISATPFTVPLGGEGPNFDNAPDASLKLGLEGKALVNNVILRSESGPPRDLGTIGLENVLLTAVFPLSSLAPGSPPKPAQVSLTGGILGSADHRILDLKGSGRVLIADRKPSGDLNADLSVNLLDAAWVDSFVGQPGLIAEGIGNTATIDAAAVVSFPRTATTGAPPAGAGNSPAFERATLTASIKSPRLSTTEPLRATATPDRLSIDSPMIARWSVDPAWATANLLGGKSLEPGQALPARFETPLELTFSVSKLTLAMGPGVGPLKPGVFALDSQIVSPGATLLVGQGKNAAPARLTNLLARIAASKEPGALGFTLTIDDAGGGRAPDGKAAVSFAGGLHGIADAAGNPALEAARLSMNGDAYGIPTALIDALARQDGVLIEALGPTVTLLMKTREASEEGGNLSADLTSPRAEAHLRGTIRSSQFIASQPAEMVLKEITPELGSRFLQGLPAIGLLEKRPEDGPAVVKATGLTAPLDGDLRKLNGQVVIDLGVARFATSNLFGAILKIAGQKGAGTVGRRLDPITIVVKEGVASYERVTIPLGEFTFATRGTVDLVNKQLDVITYIPIGALTDEAAGILNTGAGGILSRLPAIGPATMIPFRTTGPFGQAQPKLDMQLFLKEAGNNLRPDKALEDLFKDIFKKK